jgi:methyl-accepting chemotaxis protein
MQRCLSPPNQAVTTVLERLARGDLAGRIDIRWKDEIGQMGER